MHIMQRQDHHHIQLKGALLCVVPGLSAYAERLMYALPNCGHAESVELLKRVPIVSIEPNQFNTQAKNKEH